MKLNFKKITSKAIGLGGGAIVAKIADKPLANMNPTIRGGIKVIAGILLPEIAPKNDIIENVGNGMVAVGMADIATNLVPGLAGIAGVDDGLGNLDNAIQGEFVDAVDGLDGIDGDEDGVDGLDDSLSGIE